MLNSTRYFLRLFRRQSVLQNKRFEHAQVTRNTPNNDAKKDFESLYEKYKDKIKFNSHFEQEKLKFGYFKYHMKVQRQAKQAQQKDYQSKCSPPLPIALQYLVDEERLLVEDQNETPIEEEKVFQMPLASTTQYEVLENKENEPIQEPVKEELNETDIDNWMTSYEYFDDARLQERENKDEEMEYSWSRQYGTADPSARISRVPCGGCGALLHCNDPAIPGYLPSEIFKNTTEDEQRAIECQRCHFLKEYNIALDVNVQPQEYEKLLQSIRHVKSLVVLMVDLLDYPCSIWPGIVDVIGKERPIIVVGNKVDLLPGDSVGYLGRIRDSFISEIKKTKLGEANIKKILLISAKTGYGVEELISSMFKVWLAKGDVFLVGCTNVGKSSLFNALLQSDYCKVHAVDIVKRATVSRWPGTTLNLLKFPINRPSGWKIQQRTQRLQADTRLMKMEKQIRKNQIEGACASEIPTLIGHIGRTFSDPQDYSEAFMDKLQKKKQMIRLNEKDKVFANSKWFYDTPGVIHPDQVLSLLTTEELLITVPKELIRPQTYYLHPGSTIFIAGLSRIDFLHCPEPCRFTIFCSDGLPITVTQTEHADRIYEEFLGTDLFAAPTGGPERLKKWPGLEKYPEDLEFTGQGPKLCVGDIVLSSVAWVAVTAKLGSRCRVAAWTPAGRGVYKREPSVLPHAINLKGKRLRDTPAYMIGKVFIDDNYRYGLES